MMKAKINKEGSMINTNKLLKKFIVTGISLILFSALLSSRILAQNMTFTERAAFEAASSSPVLLEDFDDFSNSQQIPQLFDGLIPFDSP